MLLFYFIIYFSELAQIFCLIFYFSAASFLSRQPCGKGLGWHLGRGGGKHGSVLPLTSGLSSRKAEMLFLLLQGMQVAWVRCGLRES